MGLDEFEGSLVYKMSSRTARAVAQRNTVFKNKNKQIKKKLDMVIYTCDLSLEELKTGGPLRLSGQPA